MKTGVLIAAAGAGILLSRAARANLVGASRGELEQAASDIATERGCSPVLLLATIDTENAPWNPDALNTGAGDLGRGGAWGLCQITERTALAVDDRVPTSDPSWTDLDAIRAPFVLTNPALNLQLGASLVAMNCERAQGVRMSEAWLCDVASLYNSGKLYADAPVRTLLEYVPRFLRNYRRRAGVA